MTFPPGANTEAQGQAFLVGNPEVFNMPAPASYSGAQTYLATDIIGGIIVHNTGGAGITATLPTAALLVQALKAIFGQQLQIGATIGCLIINGGATGTITLAAGAGGSFDTNQNAASQAILTGTSKYVMLRLTNVTPGSEAYTIYS
jgi:hypothetical protein